MSEQIKLTEEDIHLLYLSDNSDNCIIKFASLEGYDIEWTKRQAEQLKQQILQNQAIVEKIKEWYEETQQPLPEGHIPIVSLNGLSIRLEKILSTNTNALKVDEK